MDTITKSALRTREGERIEYKGELSDLFFDQGRPCVRVYDNGELRFEEIVPGSEVGLPDGTGNIVRWKYAP